MNITVLALESNIGGELSNLGVAQAGFWSGGLNSLLNNLATMALTLSVVIAILFLIQGGVKWIMSAGDKESLGSAQKTVTAAIVGLILIFSVWIIIGLIKYFFGLPGGASTPPTGPTPTRAPTSSPPASCWNDCSTVPINFKICTPGQKAGCSGDEWCANCGSGTGCFAAVAGKKDCGCYGGSARMWCKE